MSRTSKTSVFAALFLYAISFQMVSAKAQSSFYIKDGDHVSRVENGDPTKLEVEEWQVRLYKRGAATGGSDYWGLITGKTAEKVMQQLKKDQEFELQFNAWAGKGRVQDDISTNFNPLGPIAVLKNSTAGKSVSKNNSPISAQTLSRVQNVYNEVKSYYDGYHQLMSVIKEPKPQTPFDNVGDVFKEYADNLKEAFQRVSALQQKLQSSISPSLDQINNEIAEINKELTVVRNNAQTITKRLNINSNGVVPASAATPAPAAGQTNNRTDEALDRYSEQLMNAFTNMDPNDPMAAFRQINAIARQMAAAIRDETDASPDMKRLASLLISMTQASDTAVMMDYLTQITELLGNMAKD